MNSKKQLLGHIEHLQSIIDEIAPDGTTKLVKGSGLNSYILPAKLLNVGMVIENGPEEAAEKEDPELPLNKRAEILRTAEELINGDRARTYGSPEVSFGRIADIFNAMGYRHHVQIEDRPLGITKANKLDAVDAALILLGMKLSRTIGAREHEDNWVDLAGYAGLGGELAMPTEGHDDERA